MSVLLYLAQAAVPEPLMIWEIGKAVLLFVITGLLGFIANRLVKLGPMVQDHELAIYGREGANGLRRGLRDITDRVDLIEDRNTAIDAVVEAERAQYTGPDRRHTALRQLADLIKKEIEEERK